MNGNIFLIGLDEELVSLAKFCKVKLSGIIDNKKTGEWDGLKIYPEDESIIKKLQIKNIILGIDDPLTKIKLYNWYKKFNVKIISIIRDNLDVTCKYNEGLITQEKSFISLNCNIGRCVKINVGATIMHDAEIGDYVTIAPRAVLLGRVKIEENVFIGANSTILPGVVVARNSIIGAGAVVTKNVPEGTIAKGVPAIFSSRT